MNVIAIRNSEDRYVVVDKDTGEILDDAQGYGFKTAEKAYKCFHYKHRSQEQRDKEKEIKAWIKDHKEFVKNYLHSIHRSVEQKHHSNRWPKVEHNMHLCFDH